MSIEKKSDKIALFTWLAYFSHKPNFLKSIHKYFSTWHKSLSVSYCDLKKFNISDKTINKFLDFKKEFRAEKILEIIEKEKINLIYYQDKDYPKLLKEIYDPPILLFYKGDKKILNNKKLLTTIGSRKINYYGKYLNQEIISNLNNNIVIVSGLAYGIDSLCHKNAINSNKKTIAVLGSGINYSSIYPKENKQLSNDIINSGGLILSEFLPLTPPLKHHFPQRNRILAGLSTATLVIQAKEKSGALITAYMALDNNREVLSIPANINLKYNQGNNQLIKAGAKLVTSHSDIESSLNIDSL